MGESVLGREGDERCGILVRCVDLSAALVESGGPVQGKSETKGVRAFLRAGERCLTALYRLVGVAKRPERIGRNAEARHPWLIPDVSGAVLWIVECQAF